MQEAELSAFLATIKDMPVEKMVKLFVKTREAKAAANRIADAQEAEFKLIMETCENYMLAAADAAGMTGFTTPYGTTYTGETKKISIADDTAFEDFLRKQENPFVFFERRVSSTTVDAYSKENGGAIPPGLNVFRERVMRVRKAAEK